MADVKVYDYETGYPVLFEPGGTEKENTAWPKYIAEIKRIYRLFNENMNYLEVRYKELSDRLTEDEAKMTSLKKGLAANKMGTIIMWTGPASEIPDGWVICDGNNGTPDLRHKFIEGTASSSELGKFKEAGLPNITATFSAEHQGQGFHQCSGAVQASHYIDGGDDGADGAQTVLYTFDASRSSSVYGKSDTVQPEAYFVYFIMKIVDDDTV